jgi:hypothetical protein
MESTQLQPVVQPILTPPKCKFVPQRGKPCENLDILPYGFCVKHKNCTAAKKAFVEWRLQYNIKDKEPCVNVVEPVITEALPTPVIENVVSCPSQEQVYQPIEANLPVQTHSSEANLPVQTHSSEANLPVQTHSSEANLPVQTYASILEKPDPLPLKIKLRRNKYGRYEHDITHFIFNKDTKAVYAVQNQDTNGTIRRLTEKEKRLCMENGWNLYNEPEESDVEFSDGSDESDEELTDEN